MKIKFQRINEKAKMPSQKNPTDAGWDLCSTIDTTIFPDQTKLIPTGLIWEPEHIVGFVIEAQVRPRSGLSLKNSITVLNTPGTIDFSYKNEIGVILINHSTTPFVISVGDRIAQIVFNILPIAEISEGVIDTEINNRNGGFGSTGIK